MAGSRTVKDYLFVRERMLAFARKHADRKIIWITGRAGEGPDDMAYHFAKWDVPGELIEMPAAWDEHGKGAGFIRNKDMGDITDWLLMFWDGVSNGSKHMTDVMRDLGKPFTTFIMDTASIDGEWELIDFTQQQRAA